MDFTGFPLIGPHKGIVDSSAGERFEIAFGPRIGIKLVQGGQRPVRVRA